MNVRLSLAMVVAVVAGWGQTPGATTPGNGSVLGIFTDVHGQKAFPILTVTAVRVSPLPAVTVQRKATPVGMFWLPDVPPGVYMVCAQSEDGTVADDCRWNRSARRYTAVANKMARWEIPILRAKRVTVRIRGARGFAAAGKEPAADVAVGVRHPLTREFLPARYVGEAEGGLNYEISIPVDWAVELKAHSARMKIADDNGRDHDVNARVEAARLTDPPGRVIAFTATGLRAGVR